MELCCLCGTNDAVKNLNTLRMLYAQKRALDAVLPVSGLFVVLPIEIMNMILDCLPVHSWFNLAQTCRPMNFCIREHARYWCARAGIVQKSLEQLKSETMESWQQLLHHCLANMDRTQSCDTLLSLNQICDQIRSMPSFGMEYEGLQRFLLRPNSIRFILYVRGHDLSCRTILECLKYGCYSPDLWDYFSDMFRRNWPSTKAIEKMEPNDEFYKDLILES